MWYLLEDLLDQPLLMKAFIGWGWLAVWIMIFSTFSTGGNLYRDMTTVEHAPVARTRMTEDILGALAEQLDPSLVTPVVAWLVHEDCPVTGEIYSAGGGRVARFFIGMTEGYYNPALTLEDVRDHFEQIRDETGYTVPAGPSDEFKAIAKAFRG